ncbi:MAG TPA: AraC family transcriptional regulator [Candidatus Acidoferrum sp.]|nr:AraC family transcriptional regulator [Candidatus Acidoferrum sp.]
MSTLEGEELQKLMEWYKGYCAKNNDFREQMDRRAKDDPSFIYNMDKHVGTDMLMIRHNPANESKIPHSHTCFVLMYMYSGSCATMVNRKEVHLGEGDFIVLNPNVQHYNAVGAPDDILFHCNLNTSLMCHTILPLVSSDILLSGFFSGFLTNNSLNDYILFSGCETPGIRELFTQMLTVYAQRQPSYQSVLRCQLGLLLVMLASQKRLKSGAATPQHHNVRINAIIDYINANYTGVTLKRVSEYFHYHPNYLSALIREQTGKSFTDLLKDHRLTQACMLLQNSELSIEEAALSVGYKDKSSFYRAYKRKFGVAPRTGNPHVGAMMSEMAHKVNNPR